ncbi:MAG: SCP2 sterol-binding domain-containing protein [Chloroflexi bacterium]|nr:MAG: SCP2 sterol-binding domain-containing protein [Chloroflexota bacterium]
MIDTTEAFFARLAQRGYEPLLHNVSGTIRWDIGDAGSWFVTVKNGSLTVKITGNLGLAQICQRLFPDESLASGEQG